MRRFIRGARVAALVTSAYHDWWDVMGVGGAALLGVVLLFLPDPTFRGLGAAVVLAAALVWRLVGGWERRPGAERRDDGESPALRE
jgi:drug/metabolite transporter (DMT)-like permease